MPFISDTGCLKSRLRFSLSKCPALFISLTPSPTSPILSFGSMLPILCPVSITLSLNEGLYIFIFVSPSSPATKVLPLTDWLRSPASRRSCRRLLLVLLLSPLGTSVSISELCCSCKASNSLFISMASA